MKQALAATMVIVVFLAGRMPSRAGSADTGTSPTSARDASLPQTQNLQFLPLVGKSIPVSPNPCSAGALPPIYWDSRLGPGGLPRLQNVRLVPASVQPCQTYWRVTSVVFQDYWESGGDHTIYVQLKDEAGNRVNGQVLQVSSDSTGEVYGYPEEKPAWDICNCNFNWPMYGDGYNVRLIGSLPSDMVAGMIMPLNQHVNYRIIFQRTVNP